MTEKGIEWQIENHFKKFRSLISVLRTCIAKTESLLPHTKDVESITDHKNALQTNFRDTSETCDRLRGLLILAEFENKLQQVNIDFESISHEASNILSVVENRVLEIENEEFVTATKFTTRSSRRSKTSNSPKRSEAAAEAAALRAKLKYIDLEAKTKADLEKLRTMRQIDMAEAKVGAFDTLEDEKEGFCLTEIDDALPKMNPKEFVGEYIQLCVTSQPIVIKKENPFHVQTTSITPPFVASSGNSVVSNVETHPVSVHWNPNVHEFIPKSSSVSQSVAAPTSSTWVNSIDQSIVNATSENASATVSSTGQPSHANTAPPPPSSSIDQKLLDLAKSIADQVSITRLPSPEPSIFHGDPLRYPGWKSAFQTLIEQRQIPANEKMHYLKKYLGGPVKDVVEQYFLLSSEDAYDEAKTLPDKRYGDPFIFANAYRDKLDKWPKITARDGTGLQKFADFLRQCYTAAQSIDHLDVLNDDHQNKKLLLKLPDWLVARWGRIVATHREKEKKFPEFKVFVDFVVKEAKIACDHVTSLQSLKGDAGQSDLDRNHKPQRNDRFKPAGGRSLLTEVQEKVPSSQKPKKSCTLCTKPGHELDECRQFLARPLDKRKESAREKGLCFGCLGTGHMSKRCKQRKRCRTCDKVHPTSLHGDVQRPRTDNKREETGRKVLNELVTEPNADCASRSGTTLMNSTGNNNKSSMVVPVYVSHIENPENERLVYALLDTQSDTTLFWRVQLRLLDCPEQMLN